MKKLMFSISITAALIGFVACNDSKTQMASNQQSNSNTTALSKDSLIKRGAYLVEVSGCHDCHSPKKMGPNGPEPDPSLLLSGHPAQMPVGKIDKAVLNEWVLFNHNTTAMVGPWGVSFAANLTSDATGIGNWTEEQFFRAIRMGKYKGAESGRSLLPPMPWYNVAKMHDEDLKAIFAFLKSTKPVRNMVPVAIAPNALP